MLKNFITTDTLKRYHPDLTDHLWNNTTDYSTQIDRGYQKVKTSLWSKSISASKIMVPVVVKTLGFESISTISEPIKVYDRGRLVLSLIQSPSTSFVVSIEGSYDKSTWSDIVNMSIASGSVTGEYTELMNTSYPYIRYSSTISQPVNYSLELYETVFDTAIIHASFAIIFSSFIKEVGDIWDLRRQLEEKSYIEVIDSLKYYYDTQGDNNPTNDEIKVSSEVMLVR